jgi:hypothetical protein
VDHFEVVTDMAVAWTAEVVWVVVVEAAEDKVAQQTSTVAATSTPQQHFAAPAFPDESSTISNLRQWSRSKQFSRSF